MKTQQASFINGHRFSLVVSLKSVFGSVLTLDSKKILGLKKHDINEKILINILFHFCHILPKDPSYTLDLSNNQTK